MTLRPRFFRVAVLAAALAPAPAWAGLTVRVEGVEGAERQNVEARLSMYAYAEGDSTDEAQIRRLHRQAEDEIRSALQAFGHYSPVIRASLRGEGDPPDFVAEYRIDAGPPTRLARVAVSLSGEGSEFPALKEALARSTLHPGEPLRHADYESTKSGLARAAYLNGFLDAKFTQHELRVDAAQATADVLLSLDTGPRYFFGEVSVEQQGLDPQFVARYVPIQPGDPFEPDKLLQAQFALSDLGYFGSVEVQPHREQEHDRRIPVTIGTTPRPPHKYDIGTGYGTDTGARMTLGAEFRQLNDRGHKLRTDLRVSEVKNSVGLDYRIPLGTRAGESLGFATAYTDEKIADGFSRRYDFAVTLSRTPGKWQRQLYLKHTWEKSYVPETGLDATKLLLPGMTLSRGEMDDPIHARLGWAIFLDGHFGSEAVVSDVTFAQGKALLRGVVPFGERVRLLGRAELGGTLIDEFRTLPASQRFFAGGDQSVRGYAYQSLAPHDAANKVIGGKFLTTYSAEAEYRIHGNWGAAVFLDAGNADDTPWPKLYKGIGTGVRYRAPVGTVQIDLAHPLDGDRKGVRPHLSIRVGL